MKTYNTQSSPYLFIVGFALNRSEQDSTVQKILSFLRLPTGWCYGRGRAPSQSVADLAIKWATATRAIGFQTTNAFPGENGEISVTAYHQNHYVEAIIETTGLISLHYEKDDTPVWSHENLPLDRARQYITAVAGEIWNTPGSYILGITTQFQASSIAPPSGYLPMITGHLLYRWNASPPTKHQFANTY